MKKKYLILFLYCSSVLSFGSCTRNDTLNTSEITTTSNQEQLKTDKGNGNSSELKTEESNPNPTTKKTYESCSLELIGNSTIDYAPHIVVRQDLNGDKTEDVFFLYGEEDVFQTCIRLQDKNGNFKLVHSDEKAYDGVFNFGGKQFHIVVPGPDELECGIVEGSLPEISESVKLKIKKKYDEWAKDTSKFNFTYNMPDMFPLMNLSLFSLAKIYTFDGFNKKDVTQEMSAYKNFKTQILNEVLQDKKLEPECAESIKRILDKI